MNKRSILIIVISAAAVCAIIFGIVFSLFSKDDKGDGTDTTAETTNAEVDVTEDEEAVPEETTGNDTERAEPEESTSADNTSEVPKPEDTTKAEGTTKADDTTKAETKKPSQSKPSQSKPSQSKPSQTKPAETTAKKPAETERPTETAKPAETAKPEETRPPVTRPVDPDRTEPWMDDFTVYDANGNKVYLTDYIGKPIVLNFWATWCVPCKKEMPDFHEKYLEYGDEVQFLMVNVTGYDTMKDIQAYLNETGYTFPVLYDVDLDAVETYKIDGYPTTLFIDAEGYIIARFRGTISADTLQKNLDKIR